MEDLLIAYLYSQRFLSGCGVDFGPQAHTSIKFDPFDGSVYRVEVSHYPAPTYDETKVEVEVSLDDLLVYLFKRTNG